MISRIETVSAAGAKHTSPGFRPGYLNRQNLISPERAEQMYGTTIVKNNPALSWREKFRSEDTGVVETYQAERGSLYRATEFFRQTNIRSRSGMNLFL